jgi:hypothetical protein
MNLEENETLRKNEYGCTLFIGTLDDHPQVVTDLLGIEASEMIVKGTNWVTPTSKKVIEGKFNEANLWIYKVEKRAYEPDVYLNHPLALMLSIMDTQREAFIDLLRRYPKNHILCYAYFYEFNPYFILTKEVVNKLNLYGIDVEFDMYYLGG